MKVPNHELAEVPRSKIVDYLLSETHRVGRHKAAFFTSAGFRVEAWDQLAEALRWHVAEHPFAASEPTKYGMSYTVEGIIRSPDGRNPFIRSVWFIEEDETIPRLVTAYPITERRDVE